MLVDGGELTLIDVREERTFSESHLLFARSVPLSRLELRFAALVPRLDTRIAGSRPNTNAVPSVSASANASTCPSSGTSRFSGIGVGRSAEAMSAHHQRASSRPATG